MIDPTKQQLEVRDWRDHKLGQEGVYAYKDNGAVIVSKDAGKWHMSMSFRDRIPTYEELKEARYYFIYDHVTMGQLFPPKSQFVNVHPYTLHLWEVPGEGSIYF